MNINIRKCEKEETKIANEFLTKLIRDEKQYDENINENCTVNYYYESVIKNEGHLILFAEVDQKVVGYIYGFLVDNGDTTIEITAEINALYIEEDYRKLGLADKLITEFIKWASLKNVKQIEISVCEGNTKAKNLYTKKNFKPIKTTMKLIL